MKLFKFNHKKKNEKNHVTENDANQEKILNEEKQDMIQGVEDLSKTSAKEVMVPRIDVDFISVDTPKNELIDKIFRSGHSRFPVYSDSIDNVIGVLYVKDLLKTISEGGVFDLKKMIRKAYFVPESKRIDSLLREFKRQHLHIAIVIDEYGGISGLITMEDIIEEIVGDIQDEFDKEVEVITLEEKNIWNCDARINLDDLNEEIKSDFPNEDFDSLGGFVFDLFGKVPAEKDTVTWNDYVFKIISMEGHRINRVEIEKKETADSENEED